MPSRVRAPRALESKAFRAMFAARKEVFVDLLKWDLPVLAEQYEMDRFDGVDAEYMIMLDGEGRHRSSARLLKTDRPHLLDELYPFLCDGPLPSGPTVREITRFCLDRHQNAAERRLARDQLVTALAEHALETGITDYTGVADLAWFQQVMRFGWHCSPLGRIALLEGRKLIALHIRIDERTLDGLRTAGIYQPRTLKLIAGEEAANEC